MGEVVKFPECMPRVVKGTAGLACHIAGASVTVSSVAQATGNLIQRDIK